MIFLADFPPPIHGMSNINDALCNKLKQKQCDDIVIIDSSPPVREKYFNTPFWLLAKILMLPILSVRMIFNFLFFGHSTLYRSINGGVGQIFDIVFVLIARVFRAEIFIHHHSFNYINEDSLLFAFLNKLAGDKAIHIVLGEDMMKGLSSLYHIPDSCFRVQSNLAFFDAAAFSQKTETEIDKKDVIKIGHLANLCEEKGLGVFIEVCQLLEKEGVDFEALLAGPFVNKKAEDLYLKNKAHVKYLGPVYGQDKDEFYQSLDVFVFPSFNEAEPLVLYEAAQKGCYLVGTARGCMRDVLMRLGGAVFVESAHLVSDIANKIKALLGSQAFSNTGAANRRELLDVKMRSDKEALSKLVDEILVKNCKL